VGVLVRTLGVVFGALFLLPFIWRSVGPRLAELPLRNWFYLCMGGFLASIVGQTFFYRALKFGEISRVVPIGASYPLIAFVLGLVLWKEPFTAGKTLGVVLVMAGLYLLR
jgi:transporter family protein